MRRRNSTRCALFAAALASSACSGVMAKGDGRAIGDDLGRFHLDATLSESTCGDGAEGAPNDFRLDVFFSVDPPHVYWNTGADSVEGTLDADGMHFTFQSETVVALPGNEPAAATCTIVRRDESSGAFDSATHARGLSGQLEYRYAPQGSSDCTQAMTSEGFATLPCRMRFKMAGSWYSAR